MFRLHMFRGGCRGGVAARIVEVSEYQFTSVGSCICVPWAVCRLEFIIIRYCIIHLFRILRLMLFSAIPKQLSLHPQNYAHFILRKHLKTTMYNVIYLQIVTLVSISSSLLPLQMVRLSLSPCRSLFYSLL